MTEVSSDAQAIVVPWLPLVGSVMLPRTSSTSGMLMAAASASAFSWSPSAGTTVAWNVLVSVAEPRRQRGGQRDVRRVVGRAGRVTVPLLAMTAVLLDDQLIVGAALALGRQRQVGRDGREVAERQRSLVGSDHESASDGASEVTSAAVSARL